MKTKFKSIILLFFVLLTSQKLFSNPAKVTYARGKVEVNRGNGWQTLKIGDEVFEADVLSTGFKSELRLNYNGSIISLAALTRISFEKLTTEGNRDIVDLYVDAGMIRAKVSKVNREPPDFKARTSVSVASVRGTDFIVVASGKVSCNNGKVGVSSVLKKKEKKSKSKQEKKKYVEIQKEKKNQSLEIVPLEEAEVLITANQTTVVNNKGKLEEPVLTSKVNENRQQSFIKSENQKVSVEIKNKKIEEKVAIPIIEPKKQEEEQPVEIITKEDTPQEIIAENNLNGSLEENAVVTEKKKEGPKPIVLPYLNIRGSLDSDIFMSEKDETDLRIDCGFDIDILDFQWLVWEVGAKYFYREYEMNGFYADTNLRFSIPGRYFEPYVGIGLSYKLYELNNIVEFPFPTLNMPISCGVLFCSHLDFRWIFMQDLSKGFMNLSETFFDDMYLSIGYKIPLRNNGLLAK